MFLSLLMNIIQFIISIHALHQYKLLDAIRNMFNRNSQSDCDSESLSDQSESDQSDSTGPPSLESSQVFRTFHCPFAYYRSKHIFKLKSFVTKQQFSPGFGVLLV